MRTPGESFTRVATAWRRSPTTEARSRPRQQVQCAARRVCANIGTDELSEAARSRLKEVRRLVAAKRNTDIKIRNGRKTGTRVAIHAARQINGVAKIGRESCRERVGQYV